MAKKKHYAATDHSIIQAITAELFCFDNQDQAREILGRVRKHYITKKTENDDVLELWIRNYALTEEEKGAGALGNFAEISIAKVKKKFTLKAIKQTVDLKNHPERKREKRHLPDWGHPILRAVKKEKIYTDVNVARAELHLLHQQFPTVSLPAIDRLQIMVYGKTEGSKERVKKVMLRITEVAENQWKIIAEDNKLARKPSPIVTEVKPNPRILGKFTAAVKPKK